MLSDGLDVLVEQVSSTFTVDGVVGTFSGIAESPLQGSVLQVEGMRESASLSITFARDLGYTPSAGDVITCKGQTWVVRSVGNEIASYVIEMEGRSQ